MTNKITGSRGNRKSWWPDDYDPPRRPKGKCPGCGRMIAIKKGVGPYADGKGELLDHKGSDDGLLHTMMRPEAI